MQITEAIHIHPYISASILTWVFNNIITAAVTSMPAPKRNSSSGYVWFFTFTNTVVGNISRAKSTTLEKSPNWQDAVDSHVQTLQNGNTPVVPESTTPSKGGD